MLRTTALALACLVAGPAIAAESPTYGKQLEGFSYPHRSSISISNPGPTPADGLHGRACPRSGQRPQRAADAWQELLRRHLGNHHQCPEQGRLPGHRPGPGRLCTSSKPAYYQYSFQQLADNTHALDQLGVKQAIVLGHSTGGMLATRYALMYPQQVERLAMVNPIGLEDWKALASVSYGGPVVCTGAQARCRRGT
ncbi:acetoin dehydrogenase E2 subunit dihydrolipoyllysine-residue acetyltransferase [Pseudomonas sp. IsoF]|nr:acetoin dehydrogenase E2 subunit dihydrolipoyllysine-residue acetyltransferase [Pseudomonas sp. IsoF]